MFEAPGGIRDGQGPLADATLASAGLAAYAPQAQRSAGLLVQRHYDLLIEVARAKRRRARLADTMGTVDLLHEAWGRLGTRVDFTDDTHFIRSVNLAMRHVIIDHARGKLSAKRGGGARPVTLEEHSPVLPEFSETPEQIVGIARLLEALEAENPRWLLVVDARYFGGMTEAETAAALGVSERTIRRDWTEARAWLARQMGVTAG